MKLTLKLIRRDGDIIVLGRNSALRILLAKAGLEACKAATKAESDPRMKFQDFIQEAK